MRINRISGSSAARLGWCLATAMWLCASTLPAAQPPGPVLGVSGDRFVVDEVPRFLVFVSYFDGIQRPLAALNADLDYLSKLGVDGVRVLPNWKAQLFGTDGAVHPAGLEKLVALVAAASARGMVVDVTFTRETSCSTGTSPADPKCAFSVAEYTAAVVKVATALKGHRNVLFDLQNEFVIHFGKEEAASVPHPIAAIRSAIKAVDPARLVTASSAGGVPPAAFAATTRALELDVIAYHDGRDSGPNHPAPNWATRTPEVIGALRGAAPAPPDRRPIYLQEPTRFLGPHEDRGDSDNRPESYLQAVTLAKRAGAAAWTFHTPAGFALDDSTPLHSADGQGLLQKGEVAVLDTLKAKVASVE